MTEGTEAAKVTEIEIDMRRLAFGEFATLDDWAFGKVSFGDALPVMQKAVTNDVDLSKLGMGEIRRVTALFRAGIRNLPGN